MKGGQVLGRRRRREMRRESLTPATWCVHDLM
jgi:hypothetical protein